MKIFLTTAFAILLFNITCRAQWTPGSGFITTTNNVGIGMTTAPAGKLQVLNSYWDLLTATYTLDIGAKSDPGGWARAFRVVDSVGSNGSDGGAFGVKGSYKTPNYVYMAIPTATTSQIGYNSPNILALDNSGNVGIGTISPTTRLHVVSSSATAGYSGISLENGGATGNETGITLKGGYTTGSLTSGRIYSKFDGGTSYTNARVTIQSMLSGGTFDDTFTATNGKVGIGTVHPDQKLTVNGTVHSKAVVVDDSILPDYVFNKTYALRPLSAVKTYIDLNHHLPEMPSAAEVAKNGQNLGEINNLLLKKVEELTLYMIEQDKKGKAAQELIQKQQTELSNQKISNLEQEVRINKLEKQLQALAEKLK
jgi:hypothetical protein